MRQVMESIIAMIFILLLCMTGMDLLAAHVEAGSAKEYRNQAIVAITNSDYDVAVINGGLRQAKELGYEMELLFYKDDGGLESVKEEIENLEGEVVMLQIRLDYVIHMPILHKELKHEIIATV